MELLCLLNICSVNKFTIFAPLNGDFQILNVIISVQLYRNDNILRYTF